MTCGQLRKTPDVRNPQKKANPFLPLSSPPLSTTAAAAAAASASPWPPFQVFLLPPPSSLLISPNVPVVVKWSGKKFNIDLDTTEPGSTFKLQIFSLTGVPPDRQKVLIKGGQLKDDQDMAQLPLKPGHNFMLLGTAEPGFKAPEKKTVFLEDMSTAEIAKSVCIPLPPISAPFWLFL